MKRFFALAALVLGLAACQTEPEGLNVNVDGEQLVTVNVTVPEAETRAGGDNSALGVFDNGVLGTADDNTTMRYILQVYLKNGEQFVQSDERLVEYSDGKTVNFEVRLVPGRDYQFVVWADVVVNGEQDIDNHYVTKNANGVSTLNDIKLNGEWNAMDESRDAFTATELIKEYSGTKSIEIKLYRPFAKLRVVTTDIESLNNLNIVPTTATVTYSEKHYNAFNAFAGKAIADTKNRDIKHDNFAIASYDENVAEGADRTLFTDYFFAENDVTQFTLEVFDQNGKLIKKNDFVTDIYVKRNYLTTIKGNILTDGKSFDVTIEDAFAGELGQEDGKTFANVDTAEELLEAINKGVENITLDGDIDLNDLLTAGTLSTRASEPALVVAAENTMTIDLNGYTISQTKTQTAAHSMITNKGTLTILDSKGNGKISYKDEGNGGNYVSNTIQNSGILTIEGGIIENNSVEAVATNGFPHPIDNSGKLVINGGTFTNNANYSSMRIWCTTDDDTEVIINGGTFNGCIDLQNVSKSANKGTLTILDSKGNGKISYKDEGNGGEYVSNTMQNSGVLTIEGGIIENNSVEAVAANGYPHPIDNSGKLVINGGIFTNNANYSSMRIWCTTDDDTEVIINGGTFNGSIDLQSVNGNANKGVLTINGGTFNADTYTKSAVRLLGFGTDVDEIFGYINGGTFNGKIKINNYVGGEFNSQVFFIKGGTFAEDPSEFVVPGYKAEQENGVYVVRKPQALIDFENAIANGNDVTLSEDLTLIDPVVVAEGKEVTINLNGKTLSGVFTKGAGAVITNNATLTVVGGTIKNTYTNGDAAINNSGELVLEDVKIEGAPLGDGGYSAYAVISSGKITINEGTEISADRGCLKLSDNGETIINGGTFVNNDIGSRSLTSHVVDVEDGGSNKLTINGGTFEHRHATTSGGVVICNRTKGTVYVNGGNFSGGNYYGNDNLSDYGYGGTFSVTGGVYSAKPAAKYIAAGYKVIEENGKFNVVLDAVDDVVSSTETLEEAIAAGNDTIALNAGEYVIPDSAGGKTIAFVGTGAPEDTLITAQNDGATEGNCDYSLRGSKATFENVTITTTGTYFPGYAGCQGTYKNCIINGVFTLYDNSSFENCTFNISGDLYNVWTWGAAEATFTNCTFNCDGKAMLLYGTANTKLTMNNCVFNDNGSISGKAAIEIGNDYNKSYELTVNKATVNGFDINPNGFVTGTTLWANKNSMTASQLKVTVDGKNAYTIVASDVAGLKAAVTAGAPTVALKAGVYDTKDFQIIGKTLTLTGIEEGVKIFNSQNNAVASGAFDGCKMTFNNLTIETIGGIYKGFARMEGVYNNCNFVNNYFTFFGKHEFNGCKFTASAPTNEHCLWTYGASELNFTECEFTYGDRCVNCYSDNDVPGGQTVNFTKCTFTTENTASLGAVETNSCYIKDGIVVNLEGCTAPAYGELVWISTWDSTNGAKTTINIK